VGTWKIRVAKSLVFVAYVGEKWMEIKNPQNHAAVKSFREHSSKGMLKGRHNAREFHDYLFAFEKGAEYGRLQSKHDFDVLKDEYLRIEEELTGLRGQLEKQTNARKSEETARMYYVEQVNKLREALGVFARLKAQKRDGFKDADSFLLEISANRARLALEGKEA
jgi:hypothetical protein